MDTNTTISLLERQIKEVQSMTHPLRKQWWSRLDNQWQTIFKKAIKIDSEPTENDLEAILSLTVLYGYRKNLTNLEPLRELTGLRELDCGWNELTSLEPLQTCPDLQTLYCAFNQLTSLEPLQACTKLQTLGCNGNELTDLEPLQSCPGLQTLYCDANELTNLEPLRGCLALQKLSCCENLLTSLEPLHGLQSLRKLYCENNPFLNSQEIERFKQAVPACEVKYSDIHVKSYVSTRV